MTLKQIIAQMEIFLEQKEDGTTLIPVNEPRLKAWRNNLIEIEEKLNEQKQLAIEILESPTEKLLVRVANFQ